MAELGEGRMEMETNAAHAKSEIPVVDWLDVDRDRQKFLGDLRYALWIAASLYSQTHRALTMGSSSAPFERCAVFDAPMDVKKTAHISNTPYFRGYTLPTPADRGHGQVIENFQFGFEQTPECAHDDTSQPLHQRLFRGPNTWPDTDTLPGFRPVIETLTHTYHRLTHLLGELIVESLGEDPREFRRYFDFDSPDLAASLNHNFAIDVFSEEAQAQVRAAYDRFDAKNVGAPHRWSALRGAAHQ